MRIVFILVLLSVLLTSCKKDDEIPVYSSHGYHGTWVRTDYVDSVSVMDKRDRLQEDMYGFSILPSGDFIERRNAGFCGTPPITYENFYGSWKPVNDSMLEIKVDFYNSLVTYELLILSADNNSLRCVYYYK